MRFQLLLSVALLTGCGQCETIVNHVKVIVDQNYEPKHPVVLSVDPELQPGYDEFLYYSHVLGVSVNDKLRNVQLVDSVDYTIPGEVVIGMCYVYTASDGTVAYRDIKILKNLVDDPLTLRTTLFHEMGHCLLNLQHTGSENGEIMDAVIDISDSDALSNWDALVRFEFNSVKYP